MEIELENYILEQELERDDLATVYQGRRKSDNTAIAIKVVAPHFTFDEAFVRRFRDMTRQAAKLEHPNIIRTYEARQQGNILYVIQELISARSLDQILFNEGPFTPQRMVTIARQVASALDYAHQKSLTHGDLAVDRVYIGDNDHTVVTDFGQIQALVGTSLVKQGYAIGTPETIAPERVHGQGPTRQSDLYSLGVLCYQMLAGDPPFTGEPAAVLHAQAYEQPQPLHMVNPTISVALSETVGRMLSKGLELRYNTGSEFARALSVAIEGTAPVRAPVAAQRQASSLTPTRTWWQRPAVWLSVLAIPAIILLLAVGFGVVSLWNSLATTFTIATPTPVALVDSPVIPTPTIIQETPTPTPVPVQLVSTSLPTNTPAPPTLTPTPTNTPTPVPLPTPGPPVIAPDSPFNNLVLARGLTDDSTPRNVGTSFAPGSEPVYVFFDYTTMETNTRWTHRWTWGDTELDVYTEPWAESYADAGTAWVFYKPAEEGFQPGPYKVTLEVEGQIVATATFIIEEGGLE